MSVRGSRLPLVWMAAAPRQNNINNPPEIPVSAPLLLPPTLQPFSIVGVQNRARPPFHAQVQIQLSPVRYLCYLLFKYSFAFTKLFLLL